MKLSYEQENEKKLFDTKDEEYETDVLEDKYTEDAFVDDSIRAYLKQIGQAKLLCKEEEIELAKIMNLDLEHVKELFYYISDTISLDEPVAEENESSTLMDFIGDDNIGDPVDRVGYDMLKVQLNEQLYFLSEREQRILKLRFGLEDGRIRTLSEVGKEFDVTRERIRQIEARAIKRLRHCKNMESFISYLRW